MLWYETVFIYITYVVYFLFFISIIGISQFLGISKEKSHIYLHNLDIFRQLYVGITLLLVFNPLKKVKRCTEFHKKIIFTSAIFLLLPPLGALFPQINHMV